MNVRIKIFSGLLVTALLTSGYSAEYTKLAQTGFQFLDVNSYARAVGMGSAMTTVSNVGSAALFFNPACLAQMDQRLDIQLSQNDWFANIKHNTFSMAIKPANGRYGVIGVSAIAVDYGEFQGTMAWDNDQGYIDTEMFTPVAMALGIGYAIRLSSQFSLGGQVKFAGQDLGDAIYQNPGADRILTKDQFSAYAVAVDFGTYFNTGWKSVAFGMSLRNFSNEIKYVDEGFQLPLIFNIGLSMDLFDFLPAETRNSKLIATIDAVHPRSYPEYINAGLEYRLMNMLFVRYGYLSNRDERGSVFGFGVEKFGLKFDYSYTPFGIWDNTQCISLGFNL